MKELDPHAFELIKKMLVKNPKQRIKIQEVVKLCTCLLSKVSNGSYN